MSGVSLPVDRPVGRALVVGAGSTREQALATLRGLGYECGEAEDPYAAVLELCRGHNSYDALILALTSLYREEMAAIATVKRQFPCMEVWLCHTDGRQAALADAMRLGADGLLADDGLHRIALAGSPPSPAVLSDTTADLPGRGVARDGGASATLPHDGNGAHSDDAGVDALREVAPERIPTDEPSQLAASPAWPPEDTALDEPVLTAEELRALLLDQPVMPPSETAE